MSRLKERLRLVDPNEQEVATDVGSESQATPQEEETMERNLLKHFGDDGEDHDAGDGDGDASTAITAPQRAIRNRTAEEERKERAAIQAKQRQADAAAARRKSRGGVGLLGRLKTIRKKEDSASSKDKQPAAGNGKSSASASPSSPAQRALPVGAASPRQSIARSRKSSVSQLSRASSGRSTPTSALPGPSETLGISAFQRQRVSTNASLATRGLDEGDDAEDDLDADSQAAVSPPALSSLRTHPLLVGTPAAATASPTSAANTNLLLRDQGVEKQPDLIEKTPTHIRRSSTNRYSIAHSVEASLEDSWSVAERDSDNDDRDDDDDEPRGSLYDDYDEYGGVDWLKEGVDPPMVGASVVGTGTPKRPARSERTASAATMRTAKSHATDSDEEASQASTSRTPRGKRALAAPAPALLPATDDEDDEDSDGAHQDRQSDVNRLLKQLELGGGVAAAAAGARAISTAYTLDGDANSDAQSSVDYGTQVSATDSDPLYPDDSVSIRAAHRAAAQEQAEIRGMDPGADDDDDAPTPTLARTRAAKPTDPAHLKAVLADIEPALEESESEGEEELDEDDDLTESSIRPPITARPRRLARQDASIISEDQRRPRASRTASPLGNETWLLDSALTPEQYHYFTKAMVGAELQWEAERAFVFDPTDNRRGTVDPSMKIKEYAVFKRSSLAPENIPALPLVRFLFDTVFCMLPAFGHARTSYEKRQQRAQVYWKRGVSPLLRILQSRSLSHRVDRYGQGNGKPFNAQGTTGALLGSLHRAATSYISAVLRLDGADDVKQSWPWPAADLMKLPAFTPYRLPPEKQTRGGFEVDIACVRPGGTQTSYIISVKRRFGHPQSFVLRSEEQFYELGKALFLSLPSSFVKPPPSLDMAVVKTYDSRATGPASNAASSTAVASKKSANTLRQAGREESPAKRNGKASNDTVSSSKSRAAPSQVGEAAGNGTGAPTKPGGLAGLFGSLGRSSGGANAAKGSGQSTVSLASVDDGSSTTVAAAPLDVRDSVTSKKRASLLGSRTSLPLSSVDDTRSSAAESTSPISPVSAGSGTSNGGKTSRLFGLGSQAPPPSQKAKEGSIDYALRRLQLRDWLRDALSARGVGHHPETRNFFSVGSFTEKDLKKSTKEKIEANRRADDVATKQREEIAVDAGEEVLDLRDQIDAMWEECKTGDGFLRAKAVFGKSKSFSALPEDYQRLVTYLHLQAARLLDGMFITGDQSATNFRRARAVLDTIPWKLLKVVMSEPTGLMIADLKRTLSHPSFVSKLLSAAMQDDPRKIEDGLGELKARLPSIYLRKLRRFVEVTSDDTKRLIRDQADKAGIPLVAAIERGSDAPLLEGRELSRIISATKTWKAFMETRPTALQVQVEAGRNRDIALIRDLQQALRLYSLRRDGANMRDLVRSKTFRTAIASLTQPLLDYVAKLHHRRRPLKRFVRTLEMRLHSLFELIEALRNRVHDPARTIEALTTYFDSHVQDSMSLIRILSPLFTTLHHMAHTVSEGSLDLAREWTLPSNVNSFNPLTDSALNNIKSLTDSAWLQRIRAMEVTSRWIAGDLEADREVQVIGGEGELSRTAQILPDEPEVVSLDREHLFKPFAAGFRAALEKVLV